MKTLENFMTVEETYKYLGITRETLYQYDKSGKLKAYRNLDPKRNYYNRQEVEYFKKHGARPKQMTLKEIRESKGISIEEMAQALDMSIGAYEDYETNIETMLSHGVHKLVTFAKKTDLQSFSMIKGL